MVLVDHAVEDMVASYGGAQRDDSSWVVVRWMLIKTLEKDGGR